MNTKIEQLAAECGFRSNPDIYDRSQSFDIPRFAELLVKQCLDTIHNKQIVEVVTEYEQGYNKGLKSVYSDIASDFGISQ